MVISGIAQPLHRGQQLQDLRRLSAGGKRDHHVAAHHVAQVAVQRFGRMKKESRGAGRAESSGNLARDDAALAHAGNHDAPRAAVEESNARSKSSAMGPAMRSARARKASASMRTTCSPRLFMLSWRVALTALPGHRVAERGNSPCELKTSTSPRRRRRSGERSCR